MSTIRNNINSYADLTAFNADLNKDYPNISYIQGTDEVKWNRYDPEYVVCKYNVTSTESATTLLNSNTGISYQIIDGVQQQSIQMNYIFDTLGEHTVKYKLSGTSIGGNNFYNCTALISVTIPNGITSFGSMTFYGCSNLASINIPDTVTTFAGSQTFERCNSLPTENGIRYADTCATNVVNKMETTYTLRQGTKFLLKTFYNCINITNFVIPNTIIGIYDAFEGCTGLTSVTIPNSVTTIASNSFWNCIGLTSVTIPNSVTSIGSYAFYYCISLTSITVESTTPPTLGSEAFGDTNNCPIYVPAESVAAYKRASGWSTYASRIQSIPTT